jgi:hypothetical protein
MKGVRFAWPWSDRGRSKVTAEDVRKDLIKLQGLIAQSMREARGFVRPTVVVNENGWR